MLQIVTEKFFPPGERFETLHRATLYTNYRAFRDETLTLPMGRVVPSTVGAGIRTLTAEITEKLVNPGIKPGVMISTGGDELIEDVATVISFVLDITCTTNADLAQRLLHPVRPGLGQAKLPSGQLPRTFDAAVNWTSGDSQKLNAFVTQLVGLDRSTYEKAMRAIQRFVTATHRIADDTSLAYTMLVTALESLATNHEPHVAKWDAYDDVKRRRVDSALEGVDQESAAAVRAAILENEHLSLWRRFLGFTLAHLTPAYYREEAAAAVAPISSSQLPHALERAYALRSRNVHQLHDLAPEMSIQEKAETAHVEGGLYLTITGLHRLARHVIYEFIRRAPQIETEEFDYESRLPGIIRARLAPQYWIWQSEHFDGPHALARFQGVLEHALEVMLKPDGGMPDLRPLLTRIEEIAATSKARERLPMLAIYQLWHGMMDKSLWQENPEAFLHKYEKELEAPGLISLILALLAGELPTWPIDDVLAIEQAYRKDRARNRGIVVPRRVEAAIALYVCARLAVERWDDAVRELSYAVEAMPGYAPLIEYERKFLAGEPLQVHIANFIVGRTDSEFSPQNAQAASSPDNADARENVVETDAV